MFQSPSASAPATVGVPASGATPKAASNDSPGEFTKFFETPRAPSPPPQSYATPSRPVDDTEKWLQSLEMENRASSEPPLSVAPTPSPLPSDISGGPSEFTIITEGRSNAVAVPSPAPATAVSTSAPANQEGVLFIPPAIPSVLVPPVLPVSAVPSMVQPQVSSVGSGGKEKQRVSYLPLIIIFNVLFLLAVLLVLFFVFRR